MYRTRYFASNLILSISWKLGSHDVVQQLYQAIRLMLRDCLASCR